jgi:S-methylmethionine-dependent homocysteine/selenocysteine methylase
LSLGGYRVGDRFFDKPFLGTKANRAAIDLMREIRNAYETDRAPMVISGQVGPRGDGYDPGKVMTPEEAEAYHAWQITVLRDAGVDFVSAFTMTNINEALGFARAAQNASIPSVISFTLETDGRLPTGDGLADAINAVDAATGEAPAYYMINCAHPTHFEHVLDAHATWSERVRGLRANSSQRIHAELDNATELDTGSPAELGQQYGDLLRRFPHINVLGGCCGTDHRHIEQIGMACRPDCGDTVTVIPRTVYNLSCNHQESGATCQRSDASYQSAAQYARERQCRGCDCRSTCLRSVHSRDLFESSLKFCHTRIHYIKQDPLCVMTFLPCFLS